MSKSYGNTIDIFGDEKETRKRVMSIVTDSTPVEAPKDPDTSTIVQLYALVASKEEVEEMRESFERAAAVTAISKSSCLRDCGIISRRCGNGVTKSWPTSHTSTTSWLPAQNAPTKLPIQVMARVRSAVGLK